MAETKIEWATHTQNWLAGCSKVSPACSNCYAETMTARLATMPDAPARYRDGVVEGRRWTGRVTYDPGALSRTFAGLAAAKSSRRVFVNSMSDTFHSGAPPESLTDLAAAIRGLDALRGDHVLMLLTKRPGRMLAWQREHFPYGLPSWVWVGCTVEDQRRADERIPHLLEVAAEVRFLSVEPLLGPVNLDPVFGLQPGHRWAPCLCEEIDPTDRPCIVCESRRGLGAESGIHWVIVGGESGPHARPMHPDWARSLRDQCAAAGVAFHFKQWGEFAPEDRPEVIEQCIANAAGSLSGLMRRVGKHAAGRILDGRTWDQVPGVPEVSRG